MYFSPDRVYHFNAEGELRRAYRDGLLYKAELGNLVSLDRRRDAEQTSRVSRRLLALETNEFLDEMVAAFSRCAAALAAHQRVSRGEVTTASTAAKGQTAVGRIEEWLAQLPREFAVAQSPNVI